MVHSLRFRLMLIFIGLAVVPLLLVGIVVGQLSYTSLEKQSLDLQQAVAVSVNTEIEAFIEQHENELLQMNAVYNLLGQNPDEQNTSLAALLMDKEVYREIILVNAAGEVLIHHSRYTSPTIIAGRDWAEHEAFRQPMSTNENYFSPIYFDDNTAEPHFILALPLRDLRTGNTEAVIIADLGFRPMWNLLGQIDLPEAADVYVVDQSGKIVAHRNPTIVLRGTRITPPNGNGRAHGLNDNEVFIAQATTHFGQQTLIAVVERPTSSALALANDMIQVTALVTLGALLGAGLLVWFSVRQIVMPIEALARSADAVGHGDFTQRVSVTTHDEVYGLANAFNQMSERLYDTMAGLAQENLDRERAEAALRESEVRYRNLFEDSPISLWEEDWSAVKQQIENLGISTADELRVRLTAEPELVKDLIHRTVILDVNQATLHLYGANSKTEMCEHGLATILEGQSLAAFQEEIITLFGGAREYSDEHIERKLTGEPLHTSIELVVAPGYEDSWERIFVSSLDITDRIRAEEQRLALAVERERVSLLASFINDLSHEFKTPLSIINTKLYLLERTNAQAQRQGIAKTVNEQVTYIGELVDAMLMMMRLDGTDSPMSMQSLHVSSIMRDLATRFEAQTEARQLAFTLDYPADLPPIQGDPYHLFRALAEMVENSLHFTPTGGEIVIEAQLRPATAKANGRPANAGMARPAEMVISVTDTGVGIDPGDIAHLFDRFYRVDKARTTRGAGLGLSIAKQIVDNHAGQIEVESEVGAGSTFRIVLPINATP